MKFKVMQGTELFDKLMALKSKMIEADNLALDFAKSIGAESIRRKRFCLAGGISSFEMQKRRSAWKRVFKEHSQNEYFPSDLAINKELLKRIEALPVVQYEELNSLLNYDSKAERGPSESPGAVKEMFCPGMQFGEDGCDHILLSFAEYIVSYKPVPGMTEITHSEFLELTRTITLAGFTSCVESKTS